MRALALTLVLMGALTAAIVVEAMADEGISVQSGVYTEEQAERGEKLWSERCILCHQPEELSSAGYMDGWEGQTAEDFYRLVRATMPEDNPGSLKRREYVDILAYVFQLNGLPQGESKLDVKSLKQIVIEGPFGQRGED